MPVGLGAASHVGIASHAGRVYLLSLFWLCHVTHPLDLQYDWTRECECRQSGLI